MILDMNYMTFAFIFIIPLPFFVVTRIHMWMETVWAVVAFYERVSREVHTSREMAKEMINAMSVS